MIIETIFSTLDDAGRPDFAPMGVVWGGEHLMVRPYRSTRTCRNLLAGGYGVANLTDDVLAFVRCGLFHEVLPHFPAKVAPGVVFQKTCSWREIEVISKGGSDERAELLCRILYTGRQRDFLGFCRASSAVIEAAILATRLAYCNPKTVTASLDHYGEIVDKTGGENEKQALRLIRDYIRDGGGND
jgi:hypothetical protein